MKILGIESSCDEMAAAVLVDGELRANVIHSQIELHRAWGGIVPEIASRDHVRVVSRVIQRALDEAGLRAQELDAIAATRGPGLIGSLLSGFEAAKGLALAIGRPLVGVHHLEGHIASAFLEPTPPDGPFVTLIVSGGHTTLLHVEALASPYRLLGRTRDDAAGEAFDKTAKLIGLGYPGGIEIDQRAQKGDDRRFPFPQAMPGKDNLDFSFSGLKTAAARLLKTLELPLDEATEADFCASFQRAVVENLVKKSFRATHLTQTPRLVVVGGVAANSRLRARCTERARREKIALHLPSRANCTDNAAMIARAGWARLLRGEQTPLGSGARVHWPLSELSAG